MSEWLHPAAPYLAGAVVVVVAPGWLRRVALVAAPGLAVALVLRLPDGAWLEGTLVGFSLVWMRVDPLARVFALIFALFGGLGALYAWGAPGCRLGGGALAAAGAGLGIVLAGDWVTLYIAWETLAVASFIVITDGGTARAARAALHYLLVHAAGGTCLLAGIVWHRATGGAAAIDPLSLAGPGGLVLLAFAINAAVPPLHAWLPDAYPESSPAGTVFLSAFTTKAAVYALVRVFPGADLLVWGGAAMALYGVVFAVLENDIRRLLAYHIVSQVGYMVTGAGLGSPLGLNGAVAHAVSHVLYKGLLLMGAGAVVQATGRRKLTDLGGLGPAMPATCALYLIGALSISGAPLLNGFVSKSLTVAAAAEAGRWGVYWILELAAVGTFLSVGLKLPYFVFAGADRGLRPSLVPRAMLAAMGLSAALCAGIGLVPGALYAWLPAPVAHTPYTVAHVLEALQLLTGAAVAFAWFRPRLSREPLVTLDADQLYRRPAAWVARELGSAAARAADALESWADSLVGGPGAPRWGALATGSPLGQPVGSTVLLALTALALALTAAHLAR
jgi:multicomponent Na+:H+ antiporter subunit D